MQKKIVKKIETEWDLTQLYLSPTDPQIQKDMVAYGLLCTNFEKKYKGRKDYLKNASKLAKAISEFEKVTSHIQKTKPFFYFALSKHSRSDDSGILTAGLNKALDAMTKSENKILFFKLSIGTIPDKYKKKFIKDSALKEYRYFLIELFNTSKYYLSEAEEKIINLKAQPASNLWVEGMEKQISKLTIPFENKEIPIAQAQSLFLQLPTVKRRVIHNSIMKAVGSLADYAESELNAFIINKKIDDDLRGFATPYASTVLANQNDQLVVENLVKIVSNNFRIAHRFHASKAKLLKLNKLEYADRTAKIAKNTKKVSLKKTFELMFSLFEILGQPYTDIFNIYLEEGRVDMFPRKGKTAGAFSWKMRMLPGFVLLNHTENFDSVMTFAHEMGHAVHSHLASKQRPLYQGHVSSVAEVASTLFENFMFDQIFATLSQKEKIVALHDKIQDDIQTIFRQIAGFNFEKDLHYQIREKGALSKDDMAKLMNKHMQSYLGPKFILTPLDGNNYINWAHLRMEFYVYSYAYGQIISKALYAEYKKDKKFFAKIEAFMKAGSSKSPEDIFSDAGINVRDPKFFLIGLEAIERDIVLLEKLLKKKK